MVALNFGCLRGRVLGSGTSHDSGNRFLAVLRRTNSASACWMSFIFVSTGMLTVFSCGRWTVLRSTGVLVVSGGLLVGFGGVLVGFGGVLVGIGGVLVGFGGVLIGFGGVLVGFGWVLWGGLELEAFALVLWCREFVTSFLLFFWLPFSSFLSLGWFFEWTCLEGCCLDFDLLCLGDFERERLGDFERECPRRSRVVDLG